jgi:methylenetetrahydrofolate reductase (NADPH)
MTVVQFVKPNPAPCGAQTLMQGYSIEVMPRTLAGVEDLNAVIPLGTRVYIAHIDGTPIADMVAAASRLRKAGYTPMPHFPARIIENRATLTDWINRYQGEAGVTQGLILAGGVPAPLGDFDNAVQLLDTGAFDAAGFTRLHIAGHPEGNMDIDPKGGTQNTDAALAWKQNFSNQTDAEMAIVTQFCFEAAPVITWASRLRDQGITLPIHIGVPGPAKLQTMIKFAVMCGVGPSLRVLKRRARDVSKLLTPYEPASFVADLASRLAAAPELNIPQAHLFPLGGIKTATGWAAAQIPATDAQNRAHI